MACTLTSARGLACKDSVGGVKAIYLSDFDPTFFAGMTIAAGELTGIDDAQTVFRYDVRPNSSGMTVEVSNEVAGSANYKATLEVVLHKLTSADSVELQKVIQTRTFVYVMDANDKVYCMGLANGCVVEASTMSIGTARTDLSGYTLTITAEESVFPQQVIASADSSEADYPFDAVTGTASFTVTNPS